MATVSTPASTRPKIRLSLRSSGVAMTAAEFDALPERHFDRNCRYEIIRGVLIVAPPPGNGELDPNEELGYLLRFHQGSHPQGRVIDVSLPEQTLPGDENRRRCDRAIWVGLGRIPNLETEFPAIVVEFVSRAKRDIRRDYEEKRDEYRQGGALEYWIIDRFQRIMTVHRFARGEVAVETVVIVPETGFYQTDMIPGFTLPLAQLLDRADRWSKPPRPTRRKPPGPEGDPR